MANGAAEDGMRHPEAGSDSSRIAHRSSLLLCRHGESLWNVERRIQGQSPEAAGLSEHGRWEAEQLAERLCGDGISALYTSDLRRAVETAEIVGARLGLRATLDARWRELHMGRWEGLSVAEVEARWPEEIEASRQDPSVRRGGGESYVQARQRVDEAIAELVERHRGETVGVITHGGAMRAALAVVDGTAVGQAQRALGFPNTAVMVIAVQEGHLQALTLADDAHLAPRTP